MYRLISKEEFSCIVAKLGIEIDDSMCGNIFDVLDSDHSGFVSRGEFLGFMGFQDTDKVTIATQPKHETVARMVKEQQIDDSALRLEIYRQIPGQGVFFAGQVHFND